MAVIGESRSDLSITRETDENFGNLSAGVLFSKVATKTMVTGEGHKSTGAFHSTKFSENSGSKSNGTENFRKLISKISVNLSRLSFFWKFGNTGNFLFHLTFLPGMNRPQFL